MKIIYVSFFLYIFLKQFYMFSSGGLQLSDMFFIISFFTAVVDKNKCVNLKVKKLDFLLIAFLMAVIIINGIYTLIYFNTEFLLSTFYYAFNIMLVILFRRLIEDDDFKIGLLNILKVNLWCQFIIFALKIGRYYMEVRYMGTFNDPNQMAFFVYINFMLLVIISNLIKRKVNIIYYIFTVVLILESSSTGMLMAISIFTVIYALALILKIKLKDISLKKIILVASICFISVFIIKSNVLENLGFGNMLIFSRLEQKMSKVDNEDKKQVSIIEERGIDKLFLQPEKIIFGAGQGYFGRYKSVCKGEIHSTLPSVLFCYGIIPTIILLIWFVKSLKKIPLTAYAAVISLIIESFTLLNQRQPFFWMLFVLLSLYSYKSYEQNKMN